MHSVNWLSDQTQTELLIISNNWVNILFGAPSFSLERCTVCWLQCCNYNVQRTTLQCCAFYFKRSAVNRLLLMEHLLIPINARPQADRAVQEPKVALLSLSSKPPNFLLFPVGSFSLLAPWCVYHRSPIRTSPLTQASPVRAEKLGPETSTFTLNMYKACLIGLVMSWQTWTRGTIIIFLALGWSSP